METLITKTQALEIAHSLLTHQKGLDDYGHSAKKEAAVIINDMIELDAVERELATAKEPLTIVDLEKSP